MAKTTPAAIRNETLPLTELVQHPRNYNRHPAVQIERLSASLRKFGQVRSIVVWRGMIVAGHGLVDAARALGWTTIRAEVLPDDYPEHLALAYVVADNELGRMAEPDAAQLAAIVVESEAADAELLEAMGFDAAALDALLLEVEREEAAQLGEPSAPRQLSDRAKAIKVVLFAEEIAAFERALAATGQRSRSEALMTVCEWYLAYAEDTEGQHDAGA